VFVPDSNHIGVSRKIEDKEERSRLRALGREVVPEGEGGVIIRTVGEELTEQTFRREFETLHGTWKKIKRRAARSTAPALLHREAKLTAGIIRDLFSEKIDSLVIDNEAVFGEVKQYLESLDPALMERVSLYQDTTPLFDKYEVESEIQEAFQRRVELPSGGHIVIEPTEALVSIDVNTGRYTGKKDPEKTVLKTNLDAAREIARQLRLRDIGGIIVCDFIDMEVKQNRERLLQELRTYLGRDRARTKAFEVSELGLIEMTRQRVRPSLYQRQTAQCPTCSGTGRIFTPDTVVRRIERTVRRISVEGSETSLVVRVHPEVALHVLEEESGFLRRPRVPVPSPGEPAGRSAHAAGRVPDPGWLGRAGRHQAVLRGVRSKDATGWLTSWRKLVCFLACDFLIRIRTTDDRAGYVRYHSYRGTAVPGRARQEDPHPQSGGRAGRHHHLRRRPARGD
jgi:ribonuclease G